MKLISATHLAFFACLSPTLLCAQEANKEAYSALCRLLQEQTQLLAAVTDVPSAVECVQPYTECMQKLQALHQVVVGDNDFVQYVENAPEKKRQLNNILFGLSREFQRLHQAQCFGVEALAELLFAPIKKESL